MKNHKRSKAPRAPRNTAPTSNPSLSGPSPMADHPDPEGAADLQGTLGNRAVLDLVQQQEGGGGEPPASPGGGGDASAPPPSGTTYSDLSGGQVHLGSGLAGPEREGAEVYEKANLRQRAGYGQLFHQARSGTLNPEGFGRAMAEREGVAAADEAGFHGQPAPSPQALRIGDQPVADYYAQQYDQVRDQGEIPVMRAIPENLLTPLSEAEDDAARQSAAVAVATWIRDNVPTQEDLESYLARVDVTDDAKTAILGRLAVELARSEFLLGWAHEGGVDAGGANGWENDGSNQGEFPSYYQDEVQTYGRSDGAEWCTSFAGHLYSRLGFQFNEDVRDNVSRSIFWSGSRLRHWATTGQSNNGTELTPEDDRVVDEGNSSELTDRDQWRELRGDLQQAGDDDAKAAAVTSFFENNPPPQPGDILILGQNNSFRSRGHSHTVVVERYDPATRTIYTVEGNKDNAVTARTICLDDPADVSQIVYITRLGVEHFTDADEDEETAPEGSPGPDSEDPQAEVLGPEAAQDEEISLAGPAWEFAEMVQQEVEHLLSRMMGFFDGELLVADVREVNAQLVEVSHDQGWIESDDPNATAHEWRHGAPEEDPGASSQDQPDQGGGG